MEQEFPLTDGANLKSKGTVDIGYSDIFIPWLFPIPAFRPLSRQPGIHTICSGIFNSSIPTFFRFIILNLCYQFCIILCIYGSDSQPRGRQVISLGSRNLFSIPGLHPWFKKNIYVLGLCWAKVLREINTL